MPTVASLPPDILTHILTLLATRRPFSQMSRSYVGRSGTCSGRPYKVRHSDARQPEITVRELRGAVAGTLAAQSTAVDDVKSRAQAMYSFRSKVLDLLRDGRSRDPWSRYTFSFRLTLLWSDIGDLRPPATANAIAVALIAVVPFGMELLHKSHIDISEDELCNVLLVHLEQLHVLFPHVKVLVRLHNCRPEEFAEVEADLTRKGVAQGLLKTLDLTNDVWDFQVSMRCGVGVGFCVSGWIR
ncbi:hypothetical protein M427DRAFT_33450 [Gonapodya prolifera JEL478]|uniref:Uncharacterized protein n=1 Tax=Gonapodya prolifera (strain JEL478) TaxID=1344416 RepID=A0A139AC67_GONPJ|nr:hypothetical protein M427DRAFT_33450 [Gonapodya prolifera JEL478]|eukprot:KXS14023.1 hypothetical protein M427DRAFT_33450 [Gonapodya prolifera JEL478]